MATAHAKHHDYHLVDPSPWPFVGSVSAFIMKNDQAAIEKFVLSVSRAAKQGVAG